MRLINIGDTWINPEHVVTIEPADDWAYPLGSGHKDPNTTTLRTVDGTTLRLTGYSVAKVVTALQPTNISLCEQ